MYYIARLYSNISTCLNDHQEAYRVLISMPMSAKEKRKSLKKRTRNRFSGIPLESDKNTTLK